MVFGTQNSHSRHVTKVQRETTDDKQQLPRPCSAFCASILRADSLPAAGSHEYGPVRRVSLIETGDRWVNATSEAQEDQTRIARVQAETTDNI